ncbi:hypothetical protein ESZ91_05665 [Candidatus Borkfalkia ceftriaxoniphila]|uniref:Uncharacterized protein n=1 Tax=Candidatus Borkfalkia ceftriaxoniphila TaxID=2508949 RepID=A0A4Q2KB80_9FIRM|nr:hypothetical protein [Candidatus Borkfalkia ceftriaxoniphila]RXZ61874.1 hypothetical protein ESZ91_05665 [Candidatus Borkfalkia ceftriaxoniphila]
MEEEQKNRCFRCENFDAYYIKKARDFKRAKFGYCAVQQKVVLNFESCKSYQLKRGWRSSKKAATMALNEILAEISAIRQVLRDNEEENFDDE